MQPVFFVMAILGCGDGSAQCTEARIAPARYNTMAQCRAALPDELARNTDLSFPVVSANCRSSGQVMAQVIMPKPRG